MHVGGKVHVRADSKKNKSQKSNMLWNEQSVNMKNFTTWNMSWIFKSDSLSSKITSAKIHLNSDFQLRKIIDFLIDVY